MAVTKPKREPAPDLELAKLIARAEAEARSQIECTQRYNDEYDKIIAYRNAVVGTLNLIIAKRGQRDHNVSSSSQRDTHPHLPLLVELRREVRRTDAELGAHVDAHFGIDRAFDGETFDQARIRIIVESGKVTPYAFARFEDPALEPLMVDQSSNKVQAQEHRTDVRKHLERVRTDHQRIVAGLKAGKIVCRGADAAERIAKEIERLSEKIERLTPRSSSRKPRTSAR